MTFSILSKFSGIMTKSKIGMVTRNIIYLVIDILDFDYYV